ncbi:MAG: ABC transporter permease [Thermosulfidibacteraceae bacterium]|jgi:peptide/nickel transport system permease protein
MKGLNGVFLIGLVLVSVVLLLALFAPFIAPYPYDRIDANAVLLPPSLEHPFGTDYLGRDVLSRVLYGARVSTIVGFISVAISTVIGMVLGAISGYFGGWVDSLIMRFVDVMLCFPTFFLILAIVSIFKPSMFNIMIIIGLTSWMTPTRLVRAEVLVIREQAYVLYAKVIGLPWWKIIMKHIIPNSFGPLLVSATMGIAQAVLVESALSFLGIGVQPPIPSWGQMLSSGKDLIDIAWWLTVFPGLAIFITVLSYNLLGEGLRRMLDPKEVEYAGK